MAERFDWQASDDHRDLIHRAVQSLVEGHLVVFPTETLYVVAAYALNPTATAKLAQLKREFLRRPPTLALVRLAECRQLVPAWGTIGERLATRCWPGPVTLVFDTPNEGQAAELPEAARTVEEKRLLVALRVCDHPILQETLRLLPGPLLLAGAGTDAVVTADQIPSATLEAAALCFDDGQTRYGRSATVLRVYHDHFAVWHEGIVTEARVRRLAGEVITFVCTGNSCRSPMAEAIFKRLLADDLGCDSVQLPERGYTIVSAGLAASPGAPASTGAREAVRLYKASLDDHVSQPMTSEIARVSDRIVTMTSDHRDFLCGLWPEAAAKTVILCGDRDVSDPVGQSVERYYETARQIVEHLRPLLVAVKTGAMARL